MTALYAFGIFTGILLAFAFAWLLILWAACWTREIWREWIERRALGIIPRTVSGILAVGILGGLLLGFAAGGLTTQYMECSGSAVCNYANR